MNVIKALKHLFIPHHKNDYTPHFFREAGIATVVFASVFLLGASFGSSLFLERTVLGVQISSGVLIDLTNESRIAYNAPPLIKSEKLAFAAELKGEDMAQKEYFSHNSPEGLTPWHWLEKAGYTFLYAGENLAIDFTDAVDVKEAWLNSPLHRANMMNAEFREIGIAVVEGVYKGYPTMYVVQMFGTPAYGETIPKEKAEVVNQTDSKLALSDVPNGKETEKETETEAQQGVVKGDSASPAADEKITVEVKQEKIQEILRTENTVVAKNMFATGAVVNAPEPLTMNSTWYERFIFNWPIYLDYIYKFLLIITALGLVILITVEVKKRHPKHVLYGSLSLLLLSIFTYINQSLM